MNSLMRVAVFSFCVASSTWAWAGWSTKNPYRTYNLTGLNYGSQNWEQTYGNKKGTSKAQGHQRMWRR